MVMGVTLGVSISASALRVGSGCTVALPSALRVGGNAQSTHQRHPGRGARSRAERIPADEAAVATGRETVHGAFAESARLGPRDRSARGRGTPRDRRGQPATSTAPPRTPANKRRNVRQSGLRLEAYVPSKCSSYAHKRLNALLSAGSLSTSVNTAQRASRSSSLRTFTEPALPSTTASLIDAAMLAEPICRSLCASSSTCCGTRRTNERSRHRTVSKLSALAFIRHAASPRSATR
jgi:hypothetical protein